MQSGSGYRRARAALEQAGKLHHTMQNNGVDFLIRDFYCRQNPAGRSGDRVKADELEQDCIEREHQCTVFLHVAVNKSEHE